MTLHEKYPRLYAKLKMSGFSPAKAIEILLDASRKDRYALTWCRIVKRMK